MLTAMAAAERPQQAVQLVEAQAEPPAPAPPRRRVVEIVIVKRAAGSPATAPVTAVRPTARNAGPAPAKAKAAATPKPAPKPKAVTRSGGS
jgi:hypothetical protein